MKPNEYDFLEFLRSCIRPSVSGRCDNTCYYTISTKRKRTNHCPQTALFFNVLIPLNILTEYK